MLIQGILRNRTLIPTDDEVKQAYVTFQHLLVSLRANTHNYTCGLRVNRCGGYACTMEEVGGGGGCRE